MEMNDPAGQMIVEDLSDRSESSHSERQVRLFQDYERTKELNLCVDKNKDEVGSKTRDLRFSLEHIRHRKTLPLDGFTDDRDRELPLDNSKDFGFPSKDKIIEDIVNYPSERTNDSESSLESTILCRSKSQTTKEPFFGFSRDTRKRNFHVTLDRSKDMNFPGDRDIKDFGILKNYNLPLEQIKEFNISMDRMRESHIGNQLALERLRGNAMLEGPTILEASDFGNVQIQSRSELEVMTLERMKRGSHLLTTTDLSAQGLGSQVPQPISQMQHTQQQQQHQAKSFTIDAILGLKNSQREKHQRGQQQQFRKHQGREGTAKNGTSSSSSGVNAGKLKRVRTIFTAEQLEQLEGVFAKQQYMVGHDRLKLAYALRLTEAQVKVWFQNRRIKWRKLHHEQQSQRLHELHQRSLLSLEHEDSNETGEW